MQRDEGHSLAISGAQEIPCKAHHCRNLTVADASQSVHPAGHSMSISFEAGVIILSKHRAHCSIKLPSPRTLFTRLEIRPKLQPLALLAVGRISDNPQSRAVRNSPDVMPSQTTPSCIKPQRGKVTEDSGKASTHKHW